MNEKTLAAYLHRTGVPRPPALDAATLRTLHRAHQLTVPFENLSIHLSEPISLDPGDLLDKIVTRRRGGFCYELDRKSTRLNSSHDQISYAVFCLKKKKKN